MNRVTCNIEDKIAVILFDNTSHANCLTEKMMNELCAIVKRLDADRSVRCVILTAAGEKAFCAGGDLKEELYNSTQDNQKMVDFIRQGNDMIQRILFGRLPYIAAVKGFALGAAPAVLSACDIVIAAPNAVFGIPTPSLGGMPGWGSTQLVPRVVGRQQTMRMLLLNEKMTASDALQAGLISEIVPAEQLTVRAMEMARTICSFPEHAMTAARRSVNQGLNQSLSSGLETELSYLQAANVHPDFVEGMKAFLEKRPPVFSS